MTLPLTKTLDPADFTDLAEELETVDQHFTKDAEQHPMRRWEYAMALRAYETWAKEATIGGPIYDVGGSGSPFSRMLDPYQVRVVDPHELDGQDLAALLHQGPRLGAAVFCLSVLEHVEDLGAFCYHLACLVAPGGLLFLTMDCREIIYTGWPPYPPEWPLDDCHFHWMRKRIFTPRLVGSLGPFHFYGLGLGQLGETDLTYHGAHVYDYTFASLALVKRP